MAGKMFRGVQLIVHPLLVLTADQTLKFSSGTDRSGPVSSHNLDKHASLSSAYQTRLLEYLFVIPADTTQTIYVVISPHVLVTHGNVCRALPRCARFGTLRSIVLDEAHLSTKQAASFRPKLRMIGATFLQPLYQNTSPNKRPFLVCTTATNSTNNHSRLKRLTRTSFPPKHCCWSPKSDFAQRSIKMMVKVGSVYSKDTTLVISHLTTFASAVFMYLNRRSPIDGIVKSPKAKFDKHNAVKANIIHIHDNAKKQLKCVNINIFTVKMTIANIFPRVLIPTSAGDMGVDHPDAQLVLNFEFTEDVSTAVQQRGQALRGGQDALFVLDAGISSCLSLVHRIGKVSVLQQPMRTELNVTTSLHDCILANLFSLNSIIFS
jgi:superfamily II DNA helicase RecQ